MGKAEEDDEEHKNLIGNRSINNESEQDKGFIDSYAIADNAVSGAYNIFALHFKALSVKWWLTSIR